MAAYARNVCKYMREISTTRIIIILLEDNISSQLLVEDNKSSQLSLFEA